jgi:2-polyprenyl-3-methyl-5-hydroxy-6-metoxy-1,4-benzoquinol methylase
MRITGSVLRHFSSLTLGTADEKHYTMKMNPLTSAAIAVIGVPHLGFRARARIVFGFFAGTPLSARILDAGAGYGIYSLTLADEGHHLDAIDIEAPRIEAINNMKDEYPPVQSRIHTHTGSLTQLPFESGAYDTIICSDVIEHIEDDHKAVAELARVLKPGGTLVLSVPYNSRYNKKIYRMFGHERPGYTAEEMRALIAPYGLSIEQVRCYEYAFGAVLFGVYNKISFKPLMAILFYPFYVLYLVDMLLKTGEPNGIGFKIRKTL